MGVSRSTMCFKVNETGRWPYFNVKLLFFLNIAALFKILLQLAYAKAAQTVWMQGEASLWDISVSMGWQWQSVVDTMTAPQGSGLIPFPSHSHPLEPLDPGSFPLVQPCLPHFPLWRAYSWSLAAQHLPFYFQSRQKVEGLPCERIKNATCLQEN